LLLMVLHLREWLLTLVVRVTSDERADYVEKRKFVRCMRDACMLEGGLRVYELGGTSMLGNM
jgi:hypothetical protein